MNQSQSSITMPGEAPVEKYTPYFKTSTKAVGQAGSWWSVKEDKVVSNWANAQQKLWLRETNAGAWPWDHHGWYTMDKLAKNAKRAERLHGWAGVLMVGCAAAYFGIKVKDWKYGH